MVQDARQRTKVYLDTYLDNSKLLKDDGSTQVKFIVAFGKPNYPITKVFKTKGVDLVFSVSTPTSTPLMDPVTQAPYGYEEHVPVETGCIDKFGITGTKLKDQAKIELRRVLENYPTGSQRATLREEGNDYHLGSTPIYSDIVTINYRRDTT